MEDIWTGGDSFPTRDWNETTRQLPKVWLNLDWGSYIVTVAKTASKKIGALIRSIKFFSPEVALYLYKSTIQPCMNYCYHVWAGAPSCFLELFDKLQKWICRTVGTSLAASLELLAHCQNVSNISLFNRYYLGRCSSELAQLVPLRDFVDGSLLVILIDYIVFLPSFLDVRVHIRNCEKLVFSKIRFALFSWNTRFEIRPFAFLATKYLFSFCLHFFIVSPLALSLSNPSYSFTAVPILRGWSRSMTCKLK